MRNRPIATNVQRRAMNSGFTPLETRSAPGFAHNCVLRSPSNLSRKRKNNSLTGFTLVEVLVALAITALTLTALMNLLLNSTKLTYQVAQEFNALPVAIEEMEEIKNKDLFLDSVKEVRDYTVKSKIESDSFEDFNYKTLKLEVFYKDVPQIQLYWFDIGQIKAEKSK